MCGICGVIRFDDAAIERRSIEHACATLRHRGPDHAGVWIDPSARAGLGGCRLAIIDPSPACHQPMHSPDGRFHLVFNGAIYNFGELRRELSDGGVPFHTNGDTEVVLAACAKWGVDALPRLSGMWAFAFFDSQSRTGFLARDRFGIKPLLYTASAKRLIFASELSAIRVLDETPPRLNDDSVMELLTFGYIAHPATIDRGVQRLSPRYVVTFSPKGVGEPRPYYELPQSPYTDGGRAISAAGKSHPPYGDACVRVRSALSDSVLRHRTADVPLGAFLSGGIDSSIVVAHLAEASAKPVPTFSIGYDDAHAFDERRFARLVAQRFGTEHHEVVLNEQDVLRAIPDVLDHMDEPFGDSSIIPTSLVSKFARQHVTVALSGDGGDELFGGYWRYLGHASLAAYRRIPAPIRRFVLEPMLRAASVSRGGGIGNRARQLRKLLRTHESDALAQHFAWSRILSPEAETIFRHPGAGRALGATPLPRVLVPTPLPPRERGRGEGFSGASSEPSSREKADLDRILRFDLQVPLPGDMLRKVDLGSMMHSLEVRVPFLDPEVVELALGLPIDFKIRRGIRKRILVDAYRGILPDEVLDREKRGFEVPFGQYLRGPLRALFWDTVTPTTVDAIGGLDFPAIQAVFTAHADRRADHSDLLFALLALCRWVGRGGLKAARPGL